MTRVRGAGFQKRETANPTKQGGLARVLVRLPEGEDFIGCSCGWRKHHPRQKIREDSAQRHIDKRHNGKAIWL